MIVKNEFLEAGFKFKNNELYFFDANYYLAENPDVKQAKIDPFTHFANYGWKELRNPSKHFDIASYLEKHPEILEINLNPLAHLRFIAANAKHSTFTFPKECENISHEFKNIDSTLISHGKKGKIAVFASFISDGIIPLHVLMYLKELKKHTDAIIIIGDNPLLASEIKKLSYLVHYASFERHEEYDFGSYKRGIAYLREKLGDDFSQINELILCNDSAIAPIIPFDTMLDTMSKRQIDFWSITINPEIFIHLQSYFLVFKNKVLSSQAFIDFFNNVKKENTRSEVIIKYELLLTKRLHDAGFGFNSYIPYPKWEEYRAQNIKNPNLTISPCYLLQKNVPVLKFSSLYDKEVNCQSIEETQKLFESINPQLYQILSPIFKNKKKTEPVSQTLSDLEITYLRASEELLWYNDNIAPKLMLKFQESQTVHKFLDGLNGIEIGASSSHLFGLDKKNAYCNVEYSTNPSSRWQRASAFTPAKVDIVAQGYDLPFEDESLDYVFSSNGIGYFFDPIKTINEWFRVIKKNGYIALIVPHRDRTSDKLRPLIGNEECVFRYNGVYTEKNYMCKKENTSEDGCLDHDYMRVSLDGSVFDGYECAQNQNKTPHYNVWTTQSFIAFCLSREWKIINFLDVDDAIGNGFLIILQK